NDILVAGDLVGTYSGTLNSILYTNHAYDYDMLVAISQAWSAARSAYAGASDLAQGTDDILDWNTDQLAGNAGADWFIISSADTITDSSLAGKVFDGSTNPEGDRIDIVG